MRPMVRASVLALATGVAVSLAVAGTAGLASAQTAKASAQTAPESAGKPAAPRFQDIVSGMSAPGQAIMAEALSKTGREQRKLDALKATREQILTLLAAPQFDAGALAKAFERERILSQKVQADRQASLLRAATQLSAEDRKLFAEGLRSTRLHIPGETVRQIQQKAEESRRKCAGDQPAR